jgi:hypothetical protein
MTLMTFSLRWIGKTAGLRDLLEMAYKLQFPQTGSTLFALNPAPYENSFLLMKIALAAEGIYQWQSRCAKHRFVHKTFHTSSMEK